MWWRYCYRYKQYHAQTKYILSTSIIVAKASYVSINNANDSTAKSLLHGMNTRHTVEREEENKENDDITNY